MRIFILLILVMAMSCSGNAPSVPNEKSVIGSWKLMGMLKTPIDIEKVTETDFMSGFMNFKADGTFEGEISYPKFPDKTVRASGTYLVENDIITISNPGNNSVTKSTIRFEKDFLIFTPLNPEGFTAYYKPLD
ncbi:MAG: hypothetical protein WBD27_18845 [Pyrinomonadaceae bacterium]